MQHFDILIQNGTILTMNPLNTQIEKGFLGISGDSIVSVGSVGDMESLRPFQAEKVIDAEGCIVLPGLINGHTHASMTLFRGLADDLPLMDWLNNYIFPVESRMDAEFVYTGARLACAEMILSGTTTFCDMYLFEEEVALAAKEAGIRALVGEVLYDFDSPNYGSVDRGLAYTRSLIEKWRNDPLVSVAVEPHALFTCSPDLLRETNRVAMEYGVPLILHLAETLTEVQEIEKRYGKSPVEHLLSLALLGPHLIADHCVHISEDEIGLLSDYGVRVIHNPESNMKLASGIAPVPKMLSRGIVVGLGTDGCASNNNLDLFLEMDTAAKLHKISTSDTTVMDALTVLKMATIEGAKALGFDRLTGSLETGKKADVIIVNTKKPHLTPLYNPYSQLVYAAAGSDVTHSIVNGRLLMEDRRLLTLDVREIIDKSIEKGKYVREWVSLS